MNYYQLLGVDARATMQQIKTAYRILALENHPDRNASPGAGEFFKAVNEAYSVLGDPGSRSRYDRILRLMDPSQTGSRWPEVIARKSGEVLQAIAVGAAAAGTLYRKRKSRKGRNLRYRLKLSAGETDGVRDLSIRYLRPAACPACKGSGRDDSGGPCPECGGSGRVDRMHTASFRMPENAGSRTILRMRGHGEEGLLGSPSGDLLIELNLEEGGAS